MGVEHHALLFAWMAQEAIKRLGSRGEEAVLEGVRRYGEQRGRRMAETARAAGYGADFTAYTLFGELDMVQAGNEKRIARRTPQVEIEVTRCGWEDAWRREGLLEVGQLYCREVDAALLRGFNPGFRFAMDGTLSSGAPLCRFLYRDGRLGLGELLRYQWGRAPGGQRGGGYFPSEVRHPSRGAVPLTPTPKPVTLASNCSIRCRNGFVPANSLQPGGYPCFAKEPHPVTGLSC
jgi:hypothetical protein